MKKRLIALLVAVCAAAVGLTACGSDPSDIGQIGDWGELKSYLNKDPEWYSTDEAIRLADDILKCQLPDGGWRKAWSDFSVDGSWAKSTIDNDGTTTEISILAKVFNATGEKKYKKACLKGIDLLFDVQYDNGGWPQVFDDPGTYHAHITYNDYAMVHVLNIMLSASQQSGDFEFIDSKRAEKAKTALDKGVQCILDTQIIVLGKRTAWCQQHDEVTLAPAPARAYEHPSISAAESVGIVDFLKSLPEKSDEVIESINGAITWMTDSAIYGIKFETQGDDKVVVEDETAGPIWARFYEIGTNKPMFGDRDGSIHYDVSEISKERRTGYAWYGNWPKKLVEAGLVTK